MTIGELLSFALLGLVWFGITFLAFMIVFGEKIFAQPAPARKRKTVVIEVEVDEDFEDDIIVDISTGEILDEKKKEVVNV